MDYTSEFINHGVSKLIFFYANVLIDYLTKQLNFN